MISIDDQAGFYKCWVWLIIEPWGTPPPGWLLKGEPPAAGMAHFVQVGVTGKLDHGRRSAQEDESVVSRGWKVVPHHVFTDEALAVLPL